MQPPSLLSLTIDSALRHIAHITDLSSIPEQILLELFWKTLQAGKLTEKVLKLFIATGNEQILSVVRILNIRPILTPVLPTRLSRFIHDAKLSVSSLTIPEVNAAKLPVLQ